MKEIKNKERIYSRSSEEWMDLVEKYFEAETSNEEENLLKRFLATSEADNKKYDEIKAVMGFTTFGKRINSKKNVKRRHLDLYKWSAAALIGGIIAIGIWQISDRSQNICIAYIEGEKCTNSQEVMMQLKLSLDQVNPENEEPAIEKQIESIFSTMEETGVESNNQYR